jgi:hypothetical protein
LDCEVSFDTLDVLLLLLVIEYFLREWLIIKGSNQHSQAWVKINQSDRVPQLNSFCCFRSLSPSSLQL